MIEELQKNTFVTGTACPGCGQQLGLKLALQTLGKCILVNSSGEMTHLAKYHAFNVPFVHCGLNAAAAASGVFNAIAGDSSLPIIVYAGDGATRLHISSLLSSASRNDNFLYICSNNGGMGTMDYFFSSKEGKTAKAMLNAASYVATSSVAYPDDFIDKLKKASAIKGVKYIELFAPCPSLGKFDPSNTIEIARLAVKTGIWPLYEYENRKIILTKRPARLDPIETYINAQKRIKASDEEIQKLQDDINKEWKMLSEGRIN